MFALFRISLAFGLSTSSSLLGFSCLYTTCTFYNVQNIEGKEGSAPEKEQENEITNYNNIHTDT